jgi:hypothetical protein
VEAAVATQYEVIEVQCSYNMLELFFRVSFFHMELQQCASATTCTACLALSTVSSTTACGWCAAANKVRSVVNAVSIFLLLLPRLLLLLLLLLMMMMMLLLLLL